MMPVNSSRTRRERHSRYSPAPSKPVSPSEEIAGDSSIRVIPDATADIGDKLGRYNYQNFSPDSDVWRADDFLAIGRAVVSDNSTRPPSLLKGPQAGSRLENSPSDLDANVTNASVPSTKPAATDANTATTATAADKDRRENSWDAGETASNRKAGVKQGDDGDGNNADKSDKESVHRGGEKDASADSIIDDNDKTKTESSIKAATKGKDNDDGAKNNPNDTVSASATANITASGDDNGKTGGDSKSKTNAKDNDGGEGDAITKRRGTGNDGGDDDGGDEKVLDGASGNDGDRNNSVESEKDDERDYMDEGDDSSNSKSVKRSIDEQLGRKSMSDIEEVLDYFHDVFKNKSISFTPACDVDTFLALLASEKSFMKVHAHERNLALCNLIKSRKERTNAEMHKEQLVRGREEMSRKIEREIELRDAAVMRKPQLESEYQENKAREEQEIEATRDFREKLERARLDDLEGRRRLDRMRLKIGAIRGQMVVPTVDQIVVESPPEHSACDWDDEGGADCCDEDGFETNDNTKDESGAVEPDNTKCSKRPRSLKAPDGTWRRPYLMDENGPSAFQATIGASTSDLTWTEDADMDIDTDEESTEFRLLKNRLAMVEQEAVEWSCSLQAERKHCELVHRAKQQLEDELFQCRQNNGMKSTAVQTARLPPIAPRGSSKLDSKSVGTVRVAIRAAISNMGESISPEKSIRKKRKRSKPSRALVMTNL